jgi:c-di-GMP-binding flagellar brake protein YcgR
MKSRTRTKDDDPALWERLVLIAEKNGETSEFITRIENIKRNSYVLEMPVKRGGNFNLQKGDDVEIRYNRHDAAYTFKASIKDLFVDDSGSIEVKREGETRREQRRRYVRLNISEDINYRILEAPGNDDIGISPEFQGSLLNISAGGFLFETDKDIPRDTLLIVNFELKNRYSLENILAIVKRTEKSEEGLSLVGSEFITRDNKSKYGLEKLDDYLPSGTGTFDENLQRLIVQFIYNQQVKMRKEGEL